MISLLTASGRTFDLLEPRPSMVCIEDVAHHLALVNRYSGATRRPLSVAEHSLLVAEILERDGGVRDALLLRAALFHDAHEAYLNDITAPVKALLQHWNVPLQAIERPIVHAVESHFGTAGAAWRHAIVIKHADLRAYATEVRDLLPPHAEPLYSVNRAAVRELGIEAVDWIDLNDRDGMDWTDWRLAFRCRHEELAVRLELEAAP